VNRSTALAAAALVLASLLWSGGTVMVRALRESLPPMSLTFWRSVVAFLVVLPFAWRPLRAQWAAVRAETTRLAAAGLIGVAAFPVVLFIAVHKTQAINVGLISASEPLVIALVAWLALGHRLGFGQVLGFMVGALGVAVIVTEGKPARIGDFAVGTGDAIAVASLYVWAVYTVLVQRLPRALSARVVLAAVFAWGVAFSAPFAVVEAALHPTRLTWPAVGLVLYSGVAGAVLAFGCWNFGARVLGPGRAGFFLYLIPVFTLVLAVLALGEPLRAHHGVGAVAIACGIALATVPWRRCLTGLRQGPKRRGRVDEDDKEAS
jgi:drug/metabolite transporter (DMT)-like permease